MAKQVIKKGTLKKGQKIKVHAEGRIVTGSALIPKGPDLPMPKVEALPVNVGVNMQALLDRAIDKMVPLDYMEKLIALLATQKAQWAKERFFEDLALFQAECPVIEKLKEARDGDKVLYVYAPYEDITPITQPILTKHGFSATVRSKPETRDGVKIMSATCFLHHKDGHTEETVFEVPVGEGTRRMSPMQKVAAARTFARRYAYCDALNLSMKGEDTEYVEDAPEPPQPQPKAGVKANAQGVVSKAGPTLEQAQKALQHTLDQMVESKLYTDKEIQDFASYGMTISEDVAKLVDANLDWVAGLTERRQGARK